MIERLTPAESGFLARDSAGPRHVGQVQIFGGRTPTDPTRVAAAIAARVAQLPRYRRKVLTGPAGLGGRAWIDDPDFDIDYHVRQSTLPTPGTREQLADFVARVSARPLERSRPLWECYVVSGLADGGVAVVTKIHQALVDSLGAADLSGLSARRTDRVEPAEVWEPEPAPGLPDLLADAVAEAIRRPVTLAGTVRTGIGDLRSTARQVGRATGTLAQVARRSAGDRAFAVDTAHARRYLMVDAELAAYRDIRAKVHALGHPEPSIHGLTLTVLTGALRTWLLARGDHVRPERSIRALVPLAVPGAGSEEDGSRVEPAFVDLPVGERSPLTRLHQIEFALGRERRGMAAGELAALSGFAPPGLHTLGARVGTSLSQRMYDVLVTNVPGPQGRRYADGVPLRATYPVLPLAPGHALAVGMTSYRGQVHHGILADRDAVPDLDVLGGALAEAIEELRERATATTDPARNR